jgi:hypothetical protein
MHGNSQVYGRYSVRFRVTQPTGDYKTAWLLWPDSDVWPGDGEIDYPEGNLNEQFSAYAHYADPGGGQDAFENISTSSAWHTATTEWVPAASASISTAWSWEPRPTTSHRSRCTTCCRPRPSLRVVGSARRELLDHVLLVDDLHLASLVRQYARHFNESRPHQGLGQRVPASPVTAIDPSKPIVVKSVLGGLHVDYRRRRDP